MTRRAVLLGLLLALLAPAVRADPSQAVRVGYQKSGLLLILKHEGMLADRLAGEHVAVTWVEFPSGPPMLEALAAGSIDLAATGDTPPIFAQSAGTPLIYVAASPQPGGSYAILVPHNSPIRSLADLAGRRVGVTRGSSAHNVLIRALAHAGLDYGAVVPVFLAPADAAAAFESGAIDAWAIWDPFYAVAQADGARVLTTAETIAPTNSFYLAQRGFAQDHPAIIRDFVAALQDAARWGGTHQGEVARINAEVAGVPLAAEMLVTARFTFQAGYLTSSEIAEQQAIADTMAALGLIPAPINIRDAVWTPAS